MCPHCALLAPSLHHHDDLPSRSVRHAYQYVVLLAGWCREPRHVSVYPSLGTGAPAATEGNVGGTHSLGAALDRHFPQ